MKSLTVLQPWAWAIFHGGKDVENRPQNLAATYRGPLAIHAGLTNDDGGFANPAINAAWDRFRQNPPENAVVGILRAESLFLDHGRIIGVVDLVGSHHADTCYRRVDDRRVGDETPLGFDVYCSAKWAAAHQWHLELANPRALTVPLPYRGHQGMRDVPELIQYEIRNRLPETKDHHQ